MADDQTNQNTTPEPEGVDDYLASIDPMAARVDQGYSAIANSPVVQQGIAHMDQNLKRRYDTAVAASNGDPDAQKQLTEDSMNVAMGSLGEMPASGAIEQEVATAGKLPEGWSGKLVTHPDASQDIVFSHPDHADVTVSRNTDTDVYQVKQSNALAGLKGQKGEFQDPQDAVQHASDYINSIDKGNTPDKAFTVLPGNSFADGGEVGAEPPGVDDYISSMGSQPSPTAAGEPEGVDDYLDNLNQQQYGSPIEQAKAGLEGAAQGLIGPAAPALEQSLGVKSEDILGRAEANPTTHYGSELAGLIIPALVTGGASVAEEAAPSLAATIAKYTQTGALDAIQQKLGLVAGDTLASKIGTGAAKAAIDNMLIAGSDETSKMILNDPNTSAQTALTTVGLSGLLGGALGAGFGTVEPLFQAVAGTKLGRIAADFKGRLAEQTSSADPISTMTDELQNYYGNIKSAADEVYGATGIKARDVAKALPEMSDKMSDQAIELYTKIQSTVDKMASDEYSYPPRLTAKLQNDLDVYSTKLQEENLTPADIFTATQDLKQQLQGYSKFDKFVKPVDDSYDFIKDVKSLGYDVRGALEDQDVWGDAAKRQQAINGAFKEYLPALKDFEKKFTTDVGGENQVDPGKVATYLNQLDSPRADIKKTMLKNFLDSSEAYKKVIDQSHQNLGIESPIVASPMNVTMSTLGKKTTGSKLADMLIETGIKKAGGAGLGAITGGLFGQFLGVGKEIGSLVGAYALGPFFKSVMPAIGNALRTMPVSAEGFKVAADYSAAVAKGEVNLTRALQNIFKSEKEHVLTESMLPNENDRNRLKKQLGKIEENPNKLFDSDDKLSKYLPAHSSALSQSTGTILSYLNQLRPDVSQKAPLDTKPVVSSTQKAAFNNALNIAEQPLVVLDKVKNGTLTKDDLVHLNSMYPQLYTRMQSKMMQQIVDTKDKDVEIPYKTRIGMSMFLAQPLDSTMLPSSIMAAQPKNAQPAQSPQAPPPKRSKGTPSSSALQKIPSLYQTPGQAREREQVTKD